INYALGKHHSINLGTELIKTSASMSSVLILTNYKGDTTGFIPFTVRWKFQGIPLTLGYEYKFSALSQRFSPTVGIGVSYFISEVDANVIYYAGSPLTDSQPGPKRTGNGYGLHASLGLISQVTGRLYLISQARYRYSNGLAFSDKQEDIKVEFTGLDFSMGIGWTF
ncbi:MAG: OmpW family outer membrane protein, partial [candidate division Zixibacteria bacterium]|nr:OmpW family outer membrane protein [candidate division Zixibacteria bacterium]